MKKSFLKKIKNNVAFGTIITLESPEIAEILSSSGFDWLFLDMEHGTLATTAVQHLIQAMDERCSAIIRIPENSALWIKKALDIGCDGIIIPQVNTIEDAQKAVAAAKYPPQGTRSVGIGRAQRYGITFNEYVRTANDSVAVIIQIEHKVAVDNLDQILSVKGIDGILIGPYDLSGSMGMLGQVTSNPVQNTIKTIKNICKKASMPFGIFVMQAEAVQKEIEEGSSFVAIGIDTVILAHAARDILKIIKKG